MSILRRPDEPCYNCGGQRTIKLHDDGSIRFVSHTDCPNRPPGPIDPPRSYPKGQWFPESRVQTTPTHCAVCEGPLLKPDGRPYLHHAECNKNRSAAPEPSLNAAVGSNRQELHTAPEPSSEVEPSPLPTAEQVERLATILVNVSTTFVTDTRIKSQEYHDELRNLAAALPWIIETARDYDGMVQIGIEEIAELRAEVRRLEEEREAMKRGLENTEESYQDTLAQIERGRIWREELQAQLSAAQLEIADMKRRLEIAEDKLYATGKGLCSSCFAKDIDLYDVGEQKLRQSEERILSLEQERDAWEQIAKEMETGRDLAHKKREEAFRELDFIKKNRTRTRCQKCGAEALPSPTHALDLEMERDEARHDLEAAATRIAQLEQSRSKARERVEALPRYGMTYDDVGAAMTDVSLMPDSLRRKMRHFFDASAVLGALTGEE